MQTLTNMPHHQHHPASKVIPSTPCWRPNSVFRACEHIWCPVLTLSSDCSEERNGRSPSSRPPPGSAKPPCLLNGLRKAACLSLGSRLSQRTTTSRAFSPT